TLAVTMTTHGHLRSDQLLRAIVQHLHFVRVSMDGVGKTYESIRRRPFALLVKTLKVISKAIPFGVNYVVNKKTIADLDDAIKLATSLGAAEFLLLPEIPTISSPGIEEDTTALLKLWVERYQGALPLCVSET